MKKKMGRKLISIMLAFAMVLTGAAIAVPGVSDEAYASTNGHTQSEAVAWAKAKADEHYEINDGSGWTQCTEFVWAYYEYLIGRHVNGDAYQYLTDEFGACPSGWTRPETTSVQPGDIVIWNQYASFNAANSDYTFEHGHIGVVVEVNGNNMTTVEANAYGAPRGRTEYRYDREVSYIDGLIRPDFAPEIIPIDKATVTVPDATYTGKKLTPKPVVTYEGQTLVRGTDYKCQYKNNKNIGLATVVITGIGNCKGTVKVNFKIIPKGVSISKVSPSETMVLVIWKPILTKPTITGYQIGYSESSDMSSQKIITVKGSTKASKIINKLKSCTTYYVQLRTYKKVGESSYYSNWSAIKKATTKGTWTTYNCLVDGDTAYCAAGKSIYAVDIKTKEKKCLATEERAYFTWQLTLRDGYLYYSGAKSSGVDNDYIHRINLENGEDALLGIGSAYRIRNDRIYYGKWTVSFGANPYGHSMKLNGTNVKREKKNDGIDNTYKFYEESNKNGYSIESENGQHYEGSEGSWIEEEYLYIPDGSKVYLCDRISW